MRACSRCHDLSKPTAVFCESCGYQLVETEVALSELRIAGSARLTCPYCGRRTRLPCREHADLDQLLTDVRAGL